MAADLPAVLQFVSRGVKILAVSGSRRADALPNVPTTAELGLPEVYSESNYGIIAPTALPPTIQQKMRDTLVAVLNTPSVKAQIAALGAIATSTTPDEYRKLMQQESIKWAAVIKKGQITLE